jgi:hypothetical protein
MISAEIRVKRTPSGMRFAPEQVPAILNDGSQDLDGKGDKREKAI